MGQRSALEHIAVALGAFRWSMQHEAKMEVSWCDDVARYTQAQLNRIARELNTRPRKTLGYRTPADILAETVASTG